MNHQLRRVLTALVVVTALTHSGAGPARAGAAPKPDAPANAVESFDVGTFTESGTRRFDYLETYGVLKAQLAHQPLRLEVDTLDNPVGLRRLWLNYGKLDLAGGRGFQAALAPGMLFINDGRYFYGGFLTLSAPRLGVSVTQISFAGNRKDRNYTFSTLRLADHVSLLHYLYMQHAYTPDSYLGPALDFGSLYFWVAPSLVRPGAWSTNAQVTFKL